MHTLKSAYLLFLQRSSRLSYSKHVIAVELRQTLLDALSQRSLLGASEDFGSGVGAEHLSSIVYVVRRKVTQL